MLSNFASPWDCVYSAAKLKEDPEVPRAQHPRHRAVHFRRAPGRLALGRQEVRRLLRERQALPRRLSRGIHGRRADGERACPRGQVLAEFRGHSPADRDRLVQALGDKAVVVESPWVCSLVVSFNTKKKPFDDAARAPRAVAGDRSLGRRAGAAEDRAGAPRRRGAAPRLRACDQRAGAGQAARASRATSTRRATKRASCSRKPAPRT